MLFLAGFVAYAWTEPVSAPPTGNVEAPINVGVTTQYKAGALGVGGVLRGYADAIFDGRVGIGTTMPSAKLDVQGGDVKITAVPSGTTGSYSLNWNRIQICQFSTCAPPWKDADGDGRTYQAITDCDEGCAICYVGSSAITGAPDGKDQNCDGVVDNFGGAGPIKVCSIVGNFPIGSAQGNCTSYCLGLGFPSGLGSHSGISCCEEEIRHNINYNDCTADSSGSETNQSVEISPFTCTCQGYQ